MQMLQSLLVLGFSLQPCANGHPQVFQGRNRRDRNARPGKVLALQLQATLTF